MTKSRQKTRDFLAQTWRWLKNQWVREVPKELAYCEFECPKNQCYVGEWENCQHRVEKPNPSENPPVS